MKLKKIYKKWLLSNNLSVENLTNLEGINNLYNEVNSDNIDFFEKREIWDNPAFVSSLEKLVVNYLKNFNTELKKEIESNSTNNLKNILGNSFKLLDSIAIFELFLKNYKDLTNTNSNEKVSIPTGKGLNELHYGAPGTGKSFEINNRFRNEIMSRVTFYPDYDYTDFVGGLKPQTDECGNISYTFEGGPLAKAIIKALNNPNKQIYLIVEEINRANAASVFGDVFQLLDRDDKSGISTFSINNKDLARFIDQKTESKFQYENSGVFLPGNLSIIATMNPSDQGVFPLDAAFKRRWKQVYHSINWNDASDITLKGFGIKWKDLGRKLNKALEQCNVEEDALLGQYFFKNAELEKSSGYEIASKLLGYLWNDAVRYQRQLIFNESNSFSEILNLFENDNNEVDLNKIFVKELCDYLRDENI